MRPLPRELLPFPRPRLAARSASVSAEAIARAEGFLLLEEPRCSSCCVSLPGPASESSPAWDEAPRSAAAPPAASSPSGEAPGAGFGDSDPLAFASAVSSFAGASVAVCAGSSCLGSSCLGLALGATAGGAGAGAGGAGAGAGAGAGTAAGTASCPAPAGEADPADRRAALGLASRAMRPLKLFRLATGAAAAAVVAASSGVLVPVLLGAVVVNSVASRSAASPEGLLPATSAGLSAREGSSFDDFSASALGAGAFWGSIASSALLGFSGCSSPPRAGAGPSGAAT